jgi:hypothetical protein
VTNSLAAGKQQAVDQLYRGQPWGMHLIPERLPKTGGKLKQSQRQQGCLRSDCLPIKPNDGPDTQTRFAHTAAVHRPADLLAS